MNYNLIQEARGQVAELTQRAYEKAAAAEEQAARLKLADTVRLVLANGLGLLGVNAPEKM